MQLRPGTAAIKTEYLLDKPDPIPVDDDAAESSTNLQTSGRAPQKRPTDDEGEGDSPSTPQESAEPDAKKPRLSGAQRKKLAKEEQKKKRGANKGRKFPRAHDQLELCRSFSAGKGCQHGKQCRFSHDIENYLRSKPVDIYFPKSDELSISEPFVLYKHEATEIEEGQDIAQSLNTSTACPEYSETGKCREGLKCRFLGAHAEAVSIDGSKTIQVLEDLGKSAAVKDLITELNPVRPGLLKSLRTRQYPLPRSKEYLNAIEKESQLAERTGKSLKEDSTAGNTNGQDEMVNTTQGFEESRSQAPESNISPPEDLVIGDTARDVPIRASEKKRLHWKDKTYLAPLTTVGNLPFRRLCVSLGADITCSEMGLATSFLSATTSEWSLVRRHPSEKTFGVQLAGNKPSSLVPAAEVIAREFGEAGSGRVDFVDLNCGCPIDMVFNSGSGSALMNTATKLGKIVVGMSKALGEIPVTVKMRTGIKDGYNNAHKLMPRLANEWGASALTLHGRTRQQRYSRMADWDYIAQCVTAVREATADEDLAPIPIFGGGDCFSSQGYWECVESTGVDGVMVARGALIKPWIFTEIKERREWDISSRERLELIRQYAEYGLSHFGTDTMGVNTTRRFLCEALSFQYRYIPIGLLEHLPGKINERPPAFRGRNELETLLASPDSRDWVRISEMFLGKAPDSWTFLPKHRSNAYDGPEGQG